MCAILCTFTPITVLQSATGKRGCPEEILHSLKADEGMTTPSPPLVPLYSSQSHATTTFRQSVRRMSGLQLKEEEENRARKRNRCADPHRDWPETGRKESELCRSLHVSTTTLSQSVSAEEEEGGRGRTKKSSISIAARSAQ